MGRLLILLLAVVVAPAAAAGVQAGQLRLAAVKLTVSGDVRTLGPSRIGVGKLSCAVPAKLAVRAGRFVIGDPVELTCRNGTLTGLRYQPAPSAQTTSTVPVQSPPTTPPAAPAATGRPTSGVITFGFVELTSDGTVVQSSSFSKSSITGTIDALDTSSITVGDMTCSLPKLGLATPLVDIFEVGQNVVLTCYSNGAIAGLATTR